MFVRYGTVLLLVSLLTCGCGGSRARHNPQAKSTPTEELIDRRDADNGETDRPAEHPVGEPDFLNSVPATAEHRPEPPTDAAVTVGSVTDRQADPSGDTTRASTQTDAQTGATATESSAPEPSADVTSTPTPRDRFVLLSPAGPLVIELAMTIDGREHSTAMDELVRQAFQDADTDRDGTIGWDELRENRRFRYTYTTEVPANDNRAWDEMARQYDANRNGRAEPAELAWLLTRGARSSRSFDLITSNDYRRRNRFDSPLRRLLDLDEDGRLSGQEIAQSSVRLRSRDADVNDVLYPGDFRQQTEVMQNGQQSVGNSGPDTAVMLGQNTRWAMLMYMLQEQYAGGQPLDEKSFPVPCALFDQLDSNHDGEIVGDEIKKLSDVEASLVFAVRFGDSDGEDGPKRLELVSMSDDLGPDTSAVATSRRRVTLDLPHVTIDFFVDDMARNASGEVQAQMLLRMLDRDNNGYVEKDEITDEAALTAEDFDEADSDSDGKVYLKELLGYLGRRRSVAQSQIYASVAYQPDAFFTALDTNHDGRLTSREIDAAPSRLSSWDANEDGNLSVDEVPDSLVVAIVRGSPQRGDNSFRPVSESGREVDKPLPRWFLSTDANGDGEISTREFLGDAQQFRQIDANADGYLDRDEVAQLVSDGPASDNGQTGREQKPDAK